MFSTTGIKLIYLNSLFRFYPSVFKLGVECKILIVDVVDLAFLTVVVCVLVLHVTQMLSNL